MYPVYYPKGPQPTAFGSTGDDGDTAILPSPTPGNGKGKYKVKGGRDGNRWGNWDTFADACSGVINPCGGGTCFSQQGYARCNCPTGYVELLGTPTSKCVLATPCNRTSFNPCSGGACKNVGDGTYTCSCNNVSVDVEHLVARSGPCCSGRAMQSRREREVGEEFSLWLYSNSI